MVLLLLFLLTLLLLLLLLEPAACGLVTPGDAPPEAPVVVSAWAQWEVLAEARVEVPVHALVQATVLLAPLVLPSRLCLLGPEGRPHALPRRPPPPAAARMHRWLPLP